MNDNGLGYQNTIFFGIDPGQVGGGIAYIFRKTYGFAPMPKDPDAIANVLIEQAGEAGDVTAAGALVELVGIRKGEGVTSARDFMINFGIIQGVLTMFGAALEVRCEWDIVAAGEWQRRYDLFGRGWDYDEKKEHHLLKAIGIFPGVEVTHRGADALMIAAYAAAKYRPCDLKTVFSWLA